MSKIILLLFLTISCRDISHDLKLLESLKFSTSIKSFGLSKKENWEKEMPLSFWQPLYLFESDQKKDNICLMLRRKSAEFPLFDLSFSKTNTFDCLEGIGQEIIIFENISSLKFSSKEKIFDQSQLHLEWERKKSRKKLTLDFYNLLNQRTEKFESSASKGYFLGVRLDLLGQ